MAEAELTLTRHDLEAKIVKRCWHDEEFHKEFTADPAGVFAKYLQLPVAGLPKIVIHEELAGSWHIVLPPHPKSAGELSTQDLERVAGGVTPTSAILSTVAAATASAMLTAGSVVVSDISFEQTAKQGW
jgi:hypothetical protein